MAKDRTLDIFALLGALDVKDYDAWDKLTDEQRKEFSPYMVLRWLAGTRDERQLVFLNELANPLVFPFGTQHKELLLRLFAVCTDGQRKRYAWRNFKSSKKASRALQVVKERYGYGDREAKDALKLLSSTDVLELAERLGWQKDEVVALKKELS